MLTVDFDGPSYEFTFNVGIDLISNLMVLTPYNKFALAYSFWGMLFTQDLRT
jgi:hypothetical protein